MKKILFAIMLGSATGAAIAAAPAQQHGSAIASELQHSHPVPAADSAAALSSEPAIEFETAGAPEAPSIAATGGAAGKHTITGDFPAASGKQPAPRSTPISNTSVSPVPEPSGMAMMLSGLLLLFLAPGVRAEAGFALGRKKLHNRQA